ncbi:MAG: SGNH/GDSL hydrolase family protein [Victivallaceae bacterium]|nr:SGNH/GDSL hydrolase family protein [Victivallaceae bacterium]
MNSLARTIGKLKNGEHCTIVALGDSITEVTFHTRDRLNWVGLLEEAVFEAYGNGVCTLINSGKCASSYAEALTRIERDVLRYEPDLVIIAFGMNDAGDGLEKLPEFQKNVRRTIALIRERCGSEILIRTPNPVVPTHGVSLPENCRAGQCWESPNRPLLKYSAVLVKLADELDCACVDHYTLWTEKKYTVKHPVADSQGLWIRMGDAIHPGYIGHLAFFRELAPLFGVSKYFPWEEMENKIL